MIFGFALTANAVSGCPACASHCHAAVEVCGRRNLSSSVHLCGRAGTPLHRPAPLLSGDAARANRGLRGVFQYVEAAIEQNVGRGQRRQDLNDLVVSS